MSFLNTKFIKEVKVKKLSYHNTSDGISYVCDLYVGNTKVADVENHGNGGDSMITFYNKDGSYRASHIDSDGKTMFMKLCDKHKAGKIMADAYNNAADGFSIKNWKETDFDVDGIISTLVEDFIALKDMDKDLKRYQTKNICYGTPNSSSFKTIGWRKSISAIMSLNGGKEVVQKEIDSVKKEIKGTDQVILNTNLDKLGLKV